MSLKASLSFAILTTGNFSTLFLLDHYFLPKRPQDYYTFCPAVCPVGGFGRCQSLYGLFQHCFHWSAYRSRRAAPVCFNRRPTKFLYTPSINPLPIGHSLPIAPHNSNVPHGYRKHSSSKKGSRYLKYVQFCVEWHNTPAKKQKISPILQNIFKLGRMWDVSLFYFVV